MIRDQETLASDFRETWEQFGKGDPAAVYRVTGIVIFYLRRQGDFGDPTALEDLTQEVLVRLWRVRYNLRELFQGIVTDELSFTEPDNPPQPCFPGCGGFIELVSIKAVGHFQS